MSLKMANVISRNLAVGGVLLRLANDARAWNLYRELIFLPRRIWFWVDDKISA